MPQSQTHVRTPSASRYLQQLCKHWGHKLPVTFTPDEGHVEFEPGRSVRFSADGETLRIAVQAGDEAQLRHTEDVVVKHLRRFAFREDLGDIAWG